MKSLKCNFFPLLREIRYYKHSDYNIKNKTWKGRKALIKRYDKQKGKKQKNEV